MRAQLRISTHALREEGDIDEFVRDQQENISTHALREEGDIIQGAIQQSTVLFLPTPSARRATFSLTPFTIWINISTHALREEGDRPDTGRKCPCSNFYPRPPRGGRHPLCRRRSFCHKFLPTPSARRATAPGIILIWDRSISTHALREEGDAGTFQSCTGCDISTHALREEGDYRMGL